MNATGTRALWFLAVVAALVGCAPAVLRIEDIPPEAFENRREPPPPVEPEGRAVKDQADERPSEDAPRKE